MVAIFSGLHLYEALDKKHAACILLSEAVLRDLKRIHFAEEWNEVSAALL
jgi:hypothetical protein